VDSRRPVAEVVVDSALARDLLEAQYPAFATQPLTRVDEGWDNVTFRVGPDYALRLPRRKVAVELLLKEQRWLPVLAARLPIAVPRIVAVGLPSDRFPYPWSLVEWLPGQTADVAPLDRRQAVPFARVLRALHEKAPEEAPANPVRGVPLAARAPLVRARLDRLTLPDLEKPWREALEAPVAEEAVWLHGDLHARNVVVSNGELVGLIDWGDLAAGDVATDLACAWMLFDEADARAAFLGAYRPTESERVRAAGWAVNFASALIDSGDPTHELLGWAIAHRLSEPDRRAR
jgi:aminoglycoside phosphotransferase (APT) family kinase protein